MKDSLELLEARAEVEVEVEQRPEPEVEVKPEISCEKIALYQIYLPLLPTTQEFLTRADPEDLKALRPQSQTERIQFFRQL